MLRLVCTTLIAAITALALAIGFAAAPSISSAASPLAARSSNAAGVSVVVTPKSIDAAAWEFTVVMDTHTKPLNEDLTKAAMLVDENGQRYTPVAWNGDAPGGHHRKGVLRFTTLPPAPKVITLEIAGLGGEDKRTFRWELR